MKTEGGSVMLWHQDDSVALDGESAIIQPTTDKERQSPLDPISRAGVMDMSQLCSSCS